MTQETYLGACDSHIHIYDARFAPAPGKQVLPSTTVSEYRAQVLQPLSLQRAVIVTPTIYITDNAVTVDAIAQLGMANARGIGVLHPDVTDEEIRGLHAGGIRGIRFTLFDPASAVTSFDMIEPLAKRIHALGWHVQLHLRADQIVEHAAMIGALPCTVVFDHMARLARPDGYVKEAFDVVAALLERGNTWVKLSGPYLDATGPAYEGSFACAQALVKVAPERMVWGSDWPHPTEKTVRPDDHNLFALLERWVPEPAIRRRILVDNPQALYGFSVPLL